MAIKTVGYGGETIILPNHSISRGRKRCNKKGKSIVRFAKKSLAYGLNFDNAEGRLLEFIKSKYQCYYDANAIQVYGHDVYVFKRKFNTYILKTVLDLPKPLWEYWDEYSRSMKEETE